MQRYGYTFVQLYKKDTAFREKWEASQGVCMPHAATLLEHAAKHLNEPHYSNFVTSLLTKLYEVVKENEKDLEWFTLKFDYRNQSKPWGNSKNALERTINRLRGKIVDL